MTTHTLTGRRAGRLALTIEQLRQQGGGSLVVDPVSAAAVTRRLREAGATVTCVLGVDFPRPAPQETPKP